LSLQVIIIIINIIKAPFPLSRGFDLRRDFLTLNSIKECGGPNFGILTISWLVFFEIRGFSKGSSLVRYLVPSSKKKKKKKRGEGGRRGRGRGREGRRGREGGGGKEGRGKGKGEGRREEGGVLLKILFYNISSDSS
jgi:hypothetical protein